MPFHRAERTWFPVLQPILGSMLILMVGCQDPPLPVVEEIQPTSAHSGDLIRISGQYLDNREGVMIGDQFVPNSRISGDNHTIMLSVPSGLTTGPQEVVVTAGEGVSNPVSLNILPSIVSVTPAAARPGETITIETNFLKQDLSVWFSSQREADLTVEDYQILATVPDSAIGGDLLVILGNDTLRYPDFEVQAPPEILSVSPPFGWPGRDITLTGLNFLAEGMTVAFHPGISLSPAFLSTTTLRVAVPDQAETGHLTVESAFGADSIFFVVVPAETDKPFVNRISPTTIAPDCELRIIGGNFNSTTAVAIPTLAGPDTVKIPDLIIDPQGSMIRVAIPPDAVSGDVVVKTNEGITDPVGMVVVPMPDLTRAVPARNDRGGQVILEVQEGQVVSRVFFGNQGISGTNGAFEYRKFGPGDEIIATNVPLQASRSNEVVYLEVSEGCYSDSLPIEIVTNSTAPNAPLAGGPHTVVIPAATSTLSYINNDWISLRGDFRDPASMIGGIRSFSFCACEDLDGVVWLYDFVDPCDLEYGLNGGSPEPCEGATIFDGMEPAGKITGSKVEVFGRYTGRIDGRFEAFGSKTIILSPVDYGDQVEIVFPDFIGSIEPVTGPPGTEITLQGRFDLGSRIRFDAGTGLEPNQIVSETEATITIPDDFQFLDIASPELYLYVERPDFTESNLVRFSIALPEILSISPDTAQVGSQVTLTGNLYLQPGQDNRLTLEIGGESIPFNITSPSTLTFTVPQALAPGAGFASYPATLGYYGNTTYGANTVTFTVFP